MSIRHLACVWVVLAAVLPGGFLRAQEMPAEIAAPELAPLKAPAELPRNGDWLENLGLGGHGMGGPGMGGPGYAATWYPSRPVTSGSPGANLGLVTENLSVAAPIWKDTGDAIMFMASVRNSSFNTDATLPDSHHPFPKELWNISFGMNYLHKFDNGWTAGIGLNFGSASDKPFYGIKEMNVGFNAFLQVPVWNERDWWKFSLMYSPVGNLNFPIPGVAYVWNPREDLQVSIGLPLSVKWKPSEDLTINLMYVPLTNVNARATYRLADGLFLFGGFQWAQEAYRLADRDQQNDRFLGYEKRLIAGIRWDLWSHAALELNAGYAFDRYYGIGQNQIGSLHDRVDIAPGAFLGASFRVWF
jgi:hypothetical protein